jgi:hypothetical protein
VFCSVLAASFYFVFIISALNLLSISHDGEKIHQLRKTRNKRSISHDKKLLVLLPCLVTLEHLILTFMEDSHNTSTKSKGKGCAKFELMLDEEELISNNAGNKEAAAPVKPETMENIKKSLTNVNQQQHEEQPSGDVHMQCCCVLLDKGVADNNKPAKKKNGFLPLIGAAAAAVEPAEQLVSCRKRKILYGAFLFVLVIGVVVAAVVLSVGSVAGPSEPTNGATTFEIACAWIGIHDINTCGNVVSASNGAAGSIPSELGVLTQQTALNVSTNGLTGSIPSELGSC